MIAAWIIAGTALGYLAGRLAPGRGPRGTLREVRIRVRDDRAACLEDLVEAARTMALRVEPRRDGYTVLEQGARNPARLSVRVSDPGHVTASSLFCSPTTSNHLPFVVALALVPVFGPVTLVYAGEVYEIDGTRDPHALTRELSARQTARVRELIDARRS